jgi:ATP-binding cassette subfamily F protein 3
MTETEIRNTLGQFRFVGEDVYKEVSVLSGGERARLTLAKLILSKMNLLVLDEPTNHLDIDSREALEAALEGFDGTILAVSHDRYFIEKLATRIVEITPGRGATLVDGQSGGDFTDYHIEHKGEAYTEYRRFMEARGQGNPAKPTVMGMASAAPASDAPTASKEAYQQAKSSAAEARKRKNRLEKLQKQAEKLEAEIEAIDEELNGSAATDYVRAAELDTRKNACEEELMAVYEELEELGE